MENSVSSNNSAWIAQLHAADSLRLVMAIAGGGSTAIGQILTVCGASKTVLETTVPYSKAALQRYLGFCPSQATSVETARSMAMVSYQRAVRFCAESSNEIEDRAEDGLAGFSSQGDFKNRTSSPKICGIGVTASLVSDRAKRGEHRFHVACQTKDQTFSFSVVLEKNKRTRRQEEELVEHYIFLALAKSANLVTTEFGSPAAALTSLDMVTYEEATATSAQQQLLAGEISHFWVSPAGEEVSEEIGAETGPVDQRTPTPLAKEILALKKSPLLLFPGAFNPPHAGHYKIAQVAKEQIERPVVFELSVHNVDKPDLDFITVQQRIALLLKTNEVSSPLVLLTASPTFSEKSSLVQKRIKAPGAMFVVGVDTLIRIIDPHYYNNSLTERDAALEHLIRLGCRFLVFGRLLKEAGRKEREKSSKGEVTFQTLSDLDLPKAFRKICNEVSPEKFRHDISSTLLRTK